MTDDLNAQMAAIERAEQVSMSQRAVAERLGYPLARVRQAVWDGRIRAVHMDAAVRIPLAEVRRLAAQRGVLARQAQEDQDGGPPEAA